jgi:hypothetical protein
LLLRRADAVAVIGAALSAKAEGAGYRRIAAMLARPAETVRGWLRRFGSRLEAVRRVFTVLLRVVAADPVMPGPAMRDRPPEDHPRTSPTRTTRHTGTTGNQLTSRVTAARKLTEIAIQGEPEDQLRAPLEQLLADLVELSRRRREHLTMVGETSLADLKTRPDYAVSYAHTLVGFIEVKAPGIGADPRRFKRAHDKDQWVKLRALPNLIYTDGQTFSLWRNGEPEGRIVRLEGDLLTGKVTAPGTLLALFEDFLGWSPVPPRSPQQLAETSARLCRLLRAEVTEQLARRDPTLVGLAADWRHLLFPDATDEQFADSYAQAVTFGLLLARAEGISLEGGIDPAAKALAGSQSLIGTAMRVLTDNVVRNDTLATSVATLSRVLAVVDWPAISKGSPDAWLYFYEDFLEVYDTQSSMVVRNIAAGPDPAYEWPRGAAAADAP